MTESRLSAMVGAALRAGITIDTRTGPPGSAEIKAMESPHARCLDGGLFFTRAIWRATPLWGRPKPCIMRQPDRGQSGERPVGVGEEGGPTDHDQRSFADDRAHRGLGRGTAARGRDH